MISQTETSRPKALREPAVKTDRESGGIVQVPLIAAIIHAKIRASCATSLSFLCQVFDAHIAQHTQKQQSQQHAQRKQ